MFPPLTIHTILHFPALPRLPNPRYAVPRWLPSSSVGPDDSGDGAGSGRGRPLHTRSVEHVEIFQAGAGVEEHDRIVGAEEVAGQEFLVGDEACGAFGCGEDTFHLRPMASGGENFRIRGNYQAM